MHPARFGAALGVALCGTAVVGASCDTTQGQKITATTFAAATVLATPDYNLQVVFDGGLIDAGTIPGVVTAGLYFGQRDPTDLTKAPTPLAGANTTVSFTGTTVPLPDQNNGKYSQNSAQNPQLVYTVGAVYTFQMAYQSQSYAGAVTAPPQEQITQFHPSPYAPIVVAAGSPLTVNRTIPTGGQSLLPAFTVVIPLDASGNQREPSYTNVPQTPVDLLNFVVNDAQWTQPTINIPGTAFPSAGTNYLVTVTAVKQGDQSQFSTNLFVGSAFVAGTADIGLVQTQ